MEEGKIFSDGKAVMIQFRKTQADKFKFDGEVIVIGSDIEYIQLFMEYESDDMPMVYFYEIDLNDERFALREIEVFVDRTVKLNEDLYYDVIEACPIPTVDEFNAKIWGEGFYAMIISGEEFEKIWNTKIYTGSLTAA